MIQSHTDQSPSPDVLLAAVQRGGGVDAWHALVARFTPRVYRVARGLTAWRVLGAQTVVEHAWRAAIRAPGALDDAATLRGTLLSEMVRRALALGDSPRDISRNEDPARLAAMRAVALLPQPSRSVLVLADVGGLSLPETASILGLPEVRLKAELWHARLAVDTLRGAGTASTPTPPILAAVDAGLPAAAAPSSQSTDAASTADADGTDLMDDDAGVADLWLETPPDELLTRLANDLHDRNQRRRLAPPMRSLRLPALGVLLAVAIAAASVLLWQDAPHFARSVHYSAPASAVMRPSATGSVGERARVAIGPAERAVTPSHFHADGRVAFRARGNKSGEFSASGPRFIPPPRL